jgi:phage-related minor tail protein
MSSRRESDFERLEQLLREADEQAKEANERAERERKRAEDERRRAEDEQRNRQEAESRAQIEGKKTRPTTFEEYTRACHTLLSKPLRIQTDKSLSTQGSITSPKNKPCPTLLKPWTDFLVLQQQLFERIYEYIPRDAGLFSSTQYLTELGQDLCDRPLASEKDLEAYQRLAVERLTTHIISYLQ